MKRSEMIQVIQNYLDLCDEDPKLHASNREKAEYILGGCCETWGMLPPPYYINDPRTREEILCKLNYKADDIIIDWEPEKVGVTEIVGDLFETDCDVIAHGVNCRNGFGSGIAGIIAKIEPDIKRCYHQKYEKDEWTLGEIQPLAGEYKIFINCATQDDYGYNGEKYLDYDALRTCMKKVQAYCLKHNLTLAIPRIGCGLAGGEWSKVKEILNEVFTEMEVNVYTLEK